MIVEIVTVKAITRNYKLILYKFNVLNDLIGSKSVKPLFYKTVLTSYLEAK